MTNRSQANNDLSMAESLSCDLSVLNQAQRRRHGELVRFVMNNAVGVKELADGFEFGFKNEPEVFLKLAEWVVLERRCCPFLSFSLSVDREDGPIRVGITGPAGAKGVMKAVYEMKS